MFLLKGNDTFILSLREERLTTTRFFSSVLQKELLVSIEGWKLVLTEVRSFSDDGRC